jgi:hypothetical protein
MGGEIHTDTKEKKRKEKKREISILRAAMKLRLETSFEYSTFCHLGKAEINNFMLC